MSIENDLIEFIEGYEKLIILGVGNNLKSDDGAGCYIVNNLSEHKNVLAIDSQTMPENFTGLIRKEKPTHLLIVDACLMDELPGTIKFVDRQDFANIGISTHSMNLEYFVKYLERDLDFKVSFIGVEPKSLDYGENLTLEVFNNCNNFIKILEREL